MPGTRHAKNNTALGYFTRHERSSLGWGSQKKRLSKDTIKNFYACTICLKLCETPLICPEGDLFCKECIYQSLLTQKQKNKQRLTNFKQQQQLNQQKLENENRKNIVDKFLQFDRLQNPSNNDINHKSLHQETKNLSTPSSNVFNVSSSTSNNQSISTKNNNTNSNNNNPSILSAENPNDKRLSCFWIPSLTPDAGPKILKAPDMNTYCPGCNNSLKRKQLVSCKFILSKQDKGSILEQIKGNNHDDGKKNKKKKKHKKKDKMEDKDIKKRNERDNNLFECGSCGKALTNAIRSGCLSKCGHIICLECIKKFVSKSKCCVVCDEPCKKKHVIILSSGGTGFAAHGNQIEATKQAVAFQ